MFKAAVQQSRRERRGKEVRTTLRAIRSPLYYVLANGEYPPLRTSDPPS